MKIICSNEKKWQAMKIIIIYNNGVIICNNERK